MGRHRASTSRPRLHDRTRDARPSPTSRPCPSSRSQLPLLVVLTAVRRGRLRARRPVGQGRTPCKRVRGAPWRRSPGPWPRSPTPSCQSAGAARQSAGTFDGDARVLRPLVAIAVACSLAGFVLGLCVAYGRPVLPRPRRRAPRRPCRQLALGAHAWRCSARPLPTRFVGQTRWLVGILLGLALATVGLRPARRARHLGRRARRGVGARRCPGRCSSTSRCCSAPAPACRTACARSSPLGRTSSCRRSRAPSGAARPRRPHRARRLAAPAQAASERPSTPGDPARPEQIRTAVGAAPRPRGRPGRRRPSPPHGIPTTRQRDETVAQGDDVPWAHVWHPTHPAPAHPVRRCRARRACSCWARHRLLAPRAGARPRGRRPGPRHRPRQGRPRRGDLLGVDDTGSGHRLRDEGLRGPRRPAARGHRHGRQGGRRRRRGDRHPPDAVGHLRLTDRLDLREHRADAARRQRVAGVVVTRRRGPRADAPTRRWRCSAPGPAAPTSSTPTAPS